MTASKGLFVRQTGAAPNAVGTTPLEARLALAGLVAEQSPGVPRNGLLLQSAANVVLGRSADMSYDISACNPVINRATNEGVYTFALTGTTNVATDQAPGTGSRFDLIYVRQHDPDKGDADNLPEVGVIRGGSSTGTPTKPYASVPAGGYVLAEAQIFSGTTGTSGGSNVVTQVWLHTAARGAPIPLRNQAERDALTPFLNQSVNRLDLGVIETWNGTKWISPGKDLLWYGFDVANSAAINTSEVVVKSSGSFTFKGGRRYRIGWQAEYYMDTAGLSFQMKATTAAVGDAVGAITGLTNVVYHTIESTPSSTATSFFYMAGIYDPAADITCQVKFSAVRVAGSSGSLFLVGNTGRRIEYTIEDLGAQF